MARGAARVRLSFTRDLPVTREALDVASDEADAKLARHRKSLAMLEQELPGSRLVELLRFELESLDMRPPRGAG